MLRRKGCGVVLALLTMAAMVVGVEPTGQDDIEMVRKTVEEWVKARKDISKEKQDWTLRQEMLHERIDLVQREIKTLKEKTAEAEKKTSETHLKIAELIDENSRLKEGGEALRGVVVEFERRVKELLKRLPDPLREDIKLLIQRLPENSDHTKLSLAQRFQNVIGILDRVNKFNREITVTSEVRTLDDGTVAEVTALYVGLGQAYYTNNAGSLAGIGRPSKEGWVWTPANEAAVAISDAIAILKNEKGASFVPLPFEVQ